MLQLSDADQIPTEILADAISGCMSASHALMDVFFSMSEFLKFLLLWLKLTDNTGMSTVSELCQCLDTSESPLPPLC